MLESQKQNTIKCIEVYPVNLVLFCENLKAQIYQPDVIIPVEDNTSTGICLQDFIFFSNNCKHFQRNI